MSWVPDDVLLTYVNLFQNVGFGGQGGVWGFGLGLQYVPKNVGPVGLSIATSTKRLRRRRGRNGCNSSLSPKEPPVLRTYITKSHQGTLKNRSLFWVPEKHRTLAAG